MNNMKKWMRGALGVAACAGVLFLLVPLAKEKPELDSRAGITLASTQVAAGSAAQAAGSGTPWFDTLPSEGSPVMVSPLSTMTPPQFAADSRGKLVLNGETHANLEKLLLEEDPQAMRATLEKIANKLPTQAADELKVLVDQFQQYSKALRHSIPPENAPETAQEGFTLLDSLHALRVSYLGADVAQAMFGQEEATTRQLIATMAVDKDPTLTAQQKAERAQTLLRNGQ